MGHLATMLTLGLAFSVCGTACEASSYQTIASVTGTRDGAGPVATLTAVGPLLYGTSGYGGETGNGTIFRFDPATGVRTQLFSFQGDNGDQPQGQLLASGGLLYGTTVYGGGSGSQSSPSLGVIFSFDPASGEVHVVHRFAAGEGCNPAAGLIASGPLMYGTTEYCGAGGAGTAFSFDPATGVVSVLHAFSGGADGASPQAPLIAANGLLYGTTSSGGLASNGTVYSLDPATGVESVLHSFDPSIPEEGARPEAALVAAGRSLYGTTAAGGTSGQGTVFSLNPRSGQLQTLHDFAGEEGSQPRAAPVAAGGLLYGTTFEGGSGNSGTVWSIAPSGSGFAVVHAFAPGGDGQIVAAGLTPVGMLLFGATEYGGSVAGQGSLFKLALDGSEAVVSAFSGSTPRENVAASVLGGTLYVTASNAGANGVGEELAVQPADGATRVVGTFDTAAAIPLAQFIPFGNLLYGTSADGGVGCGGVGCGTILSIDPVSGARTVLHVFSGEDGEGSFPGAPLAALGSQLYGTTESGGDAALSGGTIFRYDPASRTTTTLHVFEGPDGLYPETGLLALGGALYGTTVSGGSAGHGTVYRYDPGTGRATTLHSFQGGSDGSAPLGGLAATGGLLYGTTSGNGSSCGTLFSLDPRSGTLNTLYAFTCGSDGSFPASPLLAVGTTLYGTTAYGGSYGEGGCEQTCGAVFSFDTKTNTLVVLHDFTGGTTDGGSPYASPIVRIGQALYGTTGSAGAAGLGTVFRITP